jgi:hypothetical protein
VFAALHWSDLATYSTALAPILALTAFLGRVLWKNIKHELRPNSGASLRDAIDRIEHAVTMTQSDIQRIDKALERHLGYHDATDTQLPQH